MRTRVKICGITSAEDAVRAAQLGADAIGLVFYEASPRCVTFEQAIQIVALLPPFVTTVGLFVDAGEAEIRGLLKQIHLDLLQFHGDETPEECALYRKPYIKAIHMKEGVDLISAEKAFSHANGLLLDTFIAGEPGGTGERFDWKMVPNEITKPILLAGGLTPVNVGFAVKTIMPYGVDVSSGVEASVGIKDMTKIANFIQAVRQVDTESN